MEGSSSNSRETVLEAARLITDHKGEDTVVLDIAETCAFADFFVIATARSSAHLAGLLRALTEFFHSRGIRPRGHHRHTAANGWLLLDCGDFIVHLMEKEQRDFYDLERLWFRAARVPYWSKSS
jgi:ribosome-associated protein